MRPFEYSNLRAGKVPYGATLGAADRQAQELSAAQAKQHPDTNADRRVGVTPLIDAEVGSVRSTLWLLAGAVACLLLIGCANVANLILARSAARASHRRVRWFPSDNIS